MIAIRVSISGPNHIYGDDSMLVTTQGLSLEGIEIERDVSLGSAGRILDGGRIGTGWPLPAGPVTTTSTDPDSVNACIPFAQFGSPRIGRVFKP